MQWNNSKNIWYDCWKKIFWAKFEYSMQKSHKPHAVAAALINYISQGKLKITMKDCGLVIASWYGCDKAKN